MNFIFVGGPFLERQKRFIESNSVGVVQNAADALQWNYINGLEALLGSRLDVLSLPYVGSFPRRFRQAYFPAEDPCHIGNASFSSLGFSNIAAIKFFSRIFALLFALLKKIDKKKEIDIIVYAAHLPFLIPPLLLRGMGFNLKILVIVPDLPEFMSEQKGVGGVLRRVNALVVRQFLRKCDYFVVLTEAMLGRLGIAAEKGIVIEGIYTPRDEMIGQRGFESDLNGQESEKNLKQILYSGTLDHRYGILELLAAFRGVDDPEATLLICGEGSARDEVLKSLAVDSRIKFLGQISRSRVLELQRTAAVLVNPRLPIGEFTKYSFPSKVIEYMGSGTPLIMYRLPGIPDEYYRYCFVPDSLSVEALTSCIDRVINMDYKDLDGLGRQAKNFVRENKGPLAQASKLLSIFGKSI